MKLIKKARQKINIVLLAVVMTFSSVQLIAAEQTTVVANKQVRIQDDFYTAVNEKWLQEAVIKPGYPSVSTFGELEDKCRVQLDAIFKQLFENQSQYKANSTERKMINLYNNYLNVEARNKTGITPIKSYMDEIKSAKDLSGITKLLNNLRIQQNTGLLNVGVGADLKDSTKNCVYINSTGLILSNSDYYTKDTEMAKTMKTAINRYLNKIAVLYGYSETEAKKKVDNAFKLDSMLAPSIIGQDEVTVDPNIYDRIYNVYTLEQLDQLAPNLKPSTMLKNIGLDKATKIILQEPEWLKALDKIYTKENVNIIKDALEIRFLYSTATLLGEKFENANKELAATLYGVEGETSREEQALNVISGIFSDEIGKLYVEKTFSKEEKEDVEALVKEIIANYKEKLQKVEWMSPETKTNAIKKLDTMTIKIGYPDKWMDYTDLDIKSIEEGSSLVENVFNIADWSFAKQVQSLNQPVDKTTFLISPQTVNACYNPSANDITFPAAILEAPYYDIHQSREANLGGIGAVIAHEISHAFDTNGSHFDEKGNVANWWTEQDYTKFEENTKKVRSFYSQIEVLSGQKVNGDLTVSENIADITAISCMLDILNKEKNPDYKAFFESWAKVWRIKSSEAYTEQLLQLDAHSPGKVRANAVVQQFEEFYEAYDVKEGDGMYVKPEDRLKIY